jgi:hypothetical protein
MSGLSVQRQQCLVQLVLWVQPELLQLFLGRREFKGQSGQQGQHPQFLAQSDRRATPGQSGLPVLLQQCLARRA